MKQDVINLMRPKKENNKNTALRGKFKTERPLSNDNCHIPDFPIKEIVY